MRTETTTIEIYSFNELTEEAKQNAIEKVRESYYDYNDFGYWAIDDCALFEPTQKELEELFSKDYKFPLLKNTRKNIYFDTERNRFLDCEDAIAVTNSNQFLLWLGIDSSKEGLEDISFTIYTPKYKNADTTIEFDDYSSDYDDLILNAKSKFDEHIQSVIDRIEKDIDYRYTDEAIIEEIESNDYEFTKDGKRY